MGFVMRKEWKFRIEDGIKNSHLSSLARGAVDITRGVLSPPSPAKLRSLTRAYGRFQSSRVRRFLTHHIDSLATFPSAAALETSSRYPACMNEPHLNRGIILKGPGPNGEKGVLHLTPEYNWLKFLNMPDAVQEVSARYDLWLTVSWSPPDYQLLYLLLRRVPGIVFVSPGNYGDSAALEEFDSRIRCVPALASDWIDPNRFHPKSWSERQTDILMVANWAPFKRHRHLFSALRRMPKSLQITMIGQDDPPYFQNNIRQQARHFGVPQEIRFVQNLPVEQVYAEQCNSRTSVILSRGEGACVVVAESFFADTPVAILRNARIGTSAYINSQTGVFLDGFNIAPQLMHLLETADQFRPREWAVENIACDRSLEKVNSFFRQHAAESSRPWTKDLVPFCWHPDPTYCRAKDWEAFLPLYNELQTRYPTGFGPKFVPRSIEASSSS